jgi:integrase
MRDSINLTRQTIRKRDGKKYVYWVVRWYTPDGKRNSEVLGRTDQMSKRQADKRRQMKEGELLAHPGRRNVSRGPELERFLECYYQARRTELSPGTLDLHRNTGQYLTAYFGGRRRLDEITRQAARAFKTSLAGGELMHVSKRPRALKSASVDLHVRNARTIFSHALDDDLIVYNPFDRLSETQPVLRDWHYVSAEEFSKLFAAAPSLAWRLLFGLARWAALRRDEALNVQWHQVDWTNNRLQIISRSDWEIKDKDPRLVPICQDLQDLLMEAFEQTPEGKNYVIPRGCIHVKNVWRDFGVICKRAGVIRYAKPIHSLRKSCITDWASQFPMHVVQEWAGHSDIDTTNQYYLKVSELEYQKAAQLRMCPEVTKLVTKPALKEPGFDENEKPESDVSPDIPDTNEESGRTDSNRRRPAWEKRAAKMQVLAITAFKDCSIRTYAMFSDCSQNWFRSVFGVVHSKLVQNFSSHKC